MNENYNDLIILDHLTGTVHIYYIKNDISSEDLEDIIINLGFSLDNCSYQVVKEAKIKKHDNIIISSNEPF